MKDITKMLYSDSPGESIDNYISNKMVKRDHNWGLFTLLLNFLFLTIMYSNRITRQQHIFIGNLK